MYKTANSSNLEAFGTNGIGVTVLACQYQSVADWGTPLLRNSFWRCYIPVTSGASLLFKGKTMPLVRDQGVIIPPETPVHGMAAGPFSIYYVHFRCTLQLSEPDPVPFPVEASIRRALDQAVNNREPSSFRKAALQLVAAGIAVLPPENLTPFISDSRITRARDIMGHCLDSRISNRELAARLHMSDTSLLRLFRETVGLSPQKEHLRLRLNHAATLLQQTDESIDHIAESCGFCDRNHFTRTFTREWQITPARYRRAVITI
jgi:AraC-like DNA-binding protein